MSFPGVSMITPPAGLAQESAHNPADSSKHSCSSPRTSRPLRRSYNFHLFALSGRRRPARLNHLADQLGAQLGARLVLRQADVGELRWVAHHGGVGVARDVGPPFPRGRVWVAGADVFRLEALEFLLGAEFVGLAGWLEDVTFGKAGC